MSAHFSGRGRFDLLPVSPGERKTLRPCHTGGRNRLSVNPEMFGIPELIQEFERASLAAHRKDPQRPIYRVITG
jgi:hypothetical protein